MRIVAGDARGIRLAVPEEGEALRPTEDRVKESLFATLGDFSGASVLDLFSGTGALGLEALSRGAAQVVLVERDARHAETIRTNLAAVCHAIAARGREPGVAKVLVAEVAKIPEILSPEYFAFILADPPYHPAASEYGARELLLDEPVKMENGFVSVPCRPGLGVHLDDDIIRAFPYRPGTEQRFKVEST